MKKHILTTLALAGLTATAFGQGTIYFDGSGNANPSFSAASGGQVFIDGVLDTSQDINAELLMNNGTSFVPVVTLLLSMGSTYGSSSAFGHKSGATGDVTSFPGKLFDVSGVGYQESFAGLGTGATGTFFVEGWLGNGINSYGASLLSGQTATFTEVMTSPTGAANTINNMPALDLAPEPSIFALSGIGVAALMLSRRKKLPLASN